jgi:hypothetical protein
VSQAANQGPERRCEPRRPAAFALWVEPESARTRASAWMLEIAGRSAAFLTAAADAPAAGARLRLVEMFSQDPMVREDSPVLPRFARVLRVDEAPGVTRRVAVRFEADADTPRPHEQTWRFVTARPQEPGWPMPPPPLASKDGLPAAPVPFAMAP